MLLAALLAASSTRAQAVLDLGWDTGLDGEVRCNISRWDALCPPLPSHPATCFACCEAHKGELLAMRCEGPLPGWNYSWADHCEGYPPPPWRPSPGPPPPPPAPAPAPGAGCTGPQNTTSQCATNFGGGNHACPSAAQPLCSGFVPNKAWVCVCVYATRVSDAHGLVSYV